MKKNKILAVITIAQIIILLTVSSYAWFAERINPSIEESSIQVAAADGLLIKLAPDSETRLVASLNEIFSDYSLFELNQVSSANAVDFFKVDFGEGLSQGDPYFVAVPFEEDGTLNMIEHGFISYDFYLQAEQYAKHVYIHRDTFISGPGSNALRIAITIGEDIYIFGNRPENGISDPYVTEAVIQDGQFDFADIDPSFVTNQRVYGFDEKGGGRELSDDDPLDEGKTLVIVPAEEHVVINVKIWLEGGDPDCTNTIASTLLDVMLMFGSANVLPAAPNVHANNTNMTIVNLTTDMEYSMIAEPSAVWIDVTDPFMTFSPQDTVYVRYSEVPGVSPPSKITEVIFD